MHKTFRKRGKKENNCKSHCQSQGLGQKIVRNENRRKKWGRKNNA